MAGIKSIKLSVALLIRSAFLVLAISILAGYVLNRQENSYLDELVLAGQLTTLALLFSFLIRFLIKPLRQIFVVADKVTAGDLNQRFDYQKDSFFSKITFSYNQLLEKIKNASQFIKSIEEGNLDAEYMSIEGEKIGEDALSGALLSMRDQMKIIEEETKERNWSTQGLAKFVEILRANDDDIQVLGDKIISNLVKYLDANQGGLFILNEEEGGNQQLELISCYAYNRKKFQERVFLPGQGLVGQAYLEKETIHMTQVPSDYVNITSGLGEATPGSIILVPLKINDQVYGILEMASFHKFENYQIGFLEKLGESIASTISTTKAAETTKRLLSESQQQTEEMRAQEEEMRQNMEELEATQEEMHRVMKEVDANEKYLNEIINVSDDVIFTIDKDLKVSTFNKAFKDSLRIRGVNAEKGIDYLTTIPDEALRSTHSTYIKRAFAGEKFDIPVEYEIDGREFHLINSYSTLRNPDGEIVAVAVYSKNVTEVVAARKEVEKHLEEAHQQARELETQEEELRQNLEELTSLQEQQQKLQQELVEQVKQLEEAKTEIERVKALEKQRADEQIAKRNKLMEQTIMKFKTRESELLQQIEKSKNLN